MSWFGMSEEELKKFAAELEKRELALKNRESDAAQTVANAQHERTLLDADKAAFAEERKAYLEEVKRTSEEKADLEKRRQEVLRLEAEARAGFAAKQNEVFKEVIEKRIEELNTRESDLASRSVRIAGDLAKIVAREGVVAKRELDVTEREQLADAGFADKASALAAEAKRQHEANLQEANILKQREEQLAREKVELERKKEEIRQRECEVADSERKRNAGYAEERSVLDSELNGKRVAWQNEDAQKRSALQKELADQKTKLLAKLSEDMDATRKSRIEEMESSVKVEREHIITAANEEAGRIRQQMALEKHAWEIERREQQDALKKECADNQKRAGELSALDGELKAKEHELAARERALEDRKNDLESEVTRLVAERKSSYDFREQSMSDEIGRLRDSLRTQEELVGLFEQLKQKLGNRDAVEVLNDLDTKTSELKSLREKLAQPNTEQLERIEALQKAVDEQKARADEKERELEEKDLLVKDAGGLKRSCNELTLDNQSLTRQLESITAAANEAEAELRRLRSAYERPSEVAARYREIEMPYITSAKFMDYDTNSEPNELKWLRGIWKKCAEYGFIFPPRIMRAFHTSLKTAEWSPITILAGVSGTGKSKLPELYSRFGGMVFDLIDVQPNWDSQESMLGFFNSIDNKFDAQSVLKLLAQSQIPDNETYEKRIERWHDMAGSALSLDPGKDEKLIAALKASNAPGLANCMSMVLLDEMNLAHPELYFAGFLSKLEERSGKDKHIVPNLEVKIGAGLPAYKLPLGRNVLWVGTMNQDETTKSLSDKVLDRSTVIYFPRPRRLKGRKKVNPMGESASVPLISKSLFAKWVVHDCEAIAELLKPYKLFVEEINDALGSVGRAIGHRVWQSIQYYMANYPDVRDAIARGCDENMLKKAMHVAFEDQLVQKVMPKLRGIDIRGEAQTKCLEKIRLLLSSGVNGAQFGLLEDFKLAQTLGYGQFMWQSANYIDENEEWPALDEGEDLASANEQQ